MFKNLTDLPLKVLDIIPDLIAQNPEPAVKEALLEKEITFEGFEIEDVCPPRPLRRRQAQAARLGQEEVQRQVLRLFERLRQEQPREMRHRPHLLQGLRGGDCRRCAV